MIFLLSRLTKRVVLWQVVLTETPNVPPNKQITAFCLEQYEIYHNRHNMQINFYVHFNHNGYYAQFVSKSNLLGLPEQ